MRRRAWVVVAVVVVAIVLALVRVSMQTTIYSSETIVRVLNPRAVAVLGEAGRVDPAREVQIQTLYANSRVVKDAALDRLGPVAKQVLALRTVGGANVDVIRMRAKSTSRTSAQQAAQTYADVFIDQRRAAVSGLLEVQAAEVRQSASVLSAEISALDTRIAQVPVPSPVGPEPAELRNLRQQSESMLTRLEELNRQSSELMLEATVRQGDTEVVSPAERPGQPDQPTPFRDVVIAGALGLFIGLALAIVLARFDDRVRRPEDLEEVVADAPVVAVPVDRRQKRALTPLALAQPGAPGVEAYRALRSVLLAHESDGAMSVVVTSPGPEEGKTTTGANLAVVLASSGRKVIIVDRDLQRPNLHEVFDLSNERGLTTLLSREGSFGEVVSTISLPDGNELDVITAGPTSARAAELLADRASAALMSAAMAGYDFVIWDTQPLLAAADPLSATSRNSGTILVTRSGRTRLRDLRDALRRLDQGSARLLAVVLNQARVGVGHVERYQRLAQKRPASSSSAPHPVPVAVGVAEELEVVPTEHSGSRADQVPQQFDVAQAADGPSPAEQPAEVVTTVGTVTGIDETQPAPPEADAGPPGDGLQPEKLTSRPPETPQSPP